MIENFLINREVSVSFPFVCRPGRPVGKNVRLEDLDFGKLKAFQIVADDGNLRAAALKMRLTPSAISAKLGRLEEIWACACSSAAPSR